MGRSTKQGFDYFPWDVDGIDEIHLDMCMDEYGSDAYALFHFVLSKIYKDKGYYVVRDKAFDFAAARKLRVDRERINSVMDSLIENDLLEIIEHHGKSYITSDGIQKQFLQMRRDCKRAGDFEMIPEIWLLKGYPWISSEEIGRFQNKSPKVKESKVKESKENKNTSPVWFPFNSFSFDEMRTVYSEEQIKDAVDIAKRKGDGYTSPEYVWGILKRKGQCEGEQKDPVKRPDPDCRICGGTGWVIKRDKDGYDTAERCECLK